MYNWEHLEDLQIAIVHQAVKDYQFALVVFHVDDSEKNKQAVKELEDWFIENSYIFCWGLGEDIMKRAKREVLKKLELE